jgi:sensor domain CHASE-containing protein
MSVLLIMLVAYVFCLFLLHLTLFLRHKYKELLRERVKNEAIEAIGKPLLSDRDLH